MTKDRNIGIQWMRAVAALLVVLDHCLFTLINKAGADPSMAPFAALLGGTGVKLFFIISGFVMIVSSTSQFGTPASLDFIRRRLIRIAPLYWITTLIYAIKQWQLGEAPAFSNLLQSLLFIPYMDSQGEMQPVYGLGWTLNYELFFYILFAVGLLGSLRSTLTLVAASLSLLVWFGSPLSPDDSPLLYFWSRPIVLFFLAGMSLPYLVKYLHARSGLLPQFGIGAAAGFSLLLIALALATGRLSALPVPLELLWLALPILLLSLTRLKPSDRHFATLARLFGDASYSIYLTHSFIIGPLARLYAKLGIDAPVLYVALSLLICALVGLFCFRFIEKPIIQFLTTRTSITPAVSQAG